MRIQISNYEKYSFQVPNGCNAADDAMNPVAVAPAPEIGPTKVEC